MIDCRETLKRFYDYLDSELPDLQCREVEEHLAACRPCLDRMEFEKHFAKFVHREGQVEVDTRELKLRLLEKIRSLDASGTPATTRVPAWSYALVGVALVLLLIPFWRGAPDRTAGDAAWPNALNPLATIHAAFSPQYQYTEADSLVRWLSHKAPLQPRVYEFASAGCALSGASVDSIWAVLFADLGGYPVTIFEASQTDFAIPAGLREVSL
jgi:mycothiol system anti-sigma-R factor